MQKRRHERPTRRTNPSGREVWIARYTGRDGKRRSAGTFNLKREAQDAILEAYDLDARGLARRGTVGGYFEGWLTRHPRTERTERSYRQRVRAVLGVRLSGVPLSDLAMNDLRRGDVNDLLTVLLVDQGRAAKGAKGVLTVLSAMLEDAITDGEAGVNPFKGVVVRSSDSRIRKAPREIRWWPWKEMHDFAAAAALPPLESEAAQDPQFAGLFEAKRRAQAPVNAWRAVYAEPLVRVLSDCGLRLGEMLALERGDFHGDTLEVRRTAYRGRVQQGTKVDHGKANAGRVVPVPAELSAMLKALPPRIDTKLLFPDPRGNLWQDRSFYRRVWEPARARTGIDPTPHEFRHSWVSLLSAAGVDPADLASFAGHTVETMLGHYTHSIGASMDKARGAVGA